MEDSGVYIRNDRSILLEEIADQLDRLLGEAAAWTRRGARFVNRPTPALSTPNRITVFFAFSASATSENVPATAEPTSHDDVAGHDVHVIACLAQVREDCHVHKS